MQVDEYFLKAKKSLGQHFLRSEKALNEMVGALTPLDKGGLEGVVFEIGPGEGVLTEKLLQNNFIVIAIEIDKRSIEILERKFVKEIQNKKLFIIERDCLEIDYAQELKSLQTNTRKEYNLVGNIPYYITGAIFRNTFEQKVLPNQVVFLIQKEVAERIVARDKKESLLSISVKIFGEPKIVDIVKAGSFVPPPKVDSAIIAINNISSPFAPPLAPPQQGGEDMEIFFKILRAAFSHKRKFLLTNLKTDLDKNLLEKYFNEIQEIFLKKYNEKVRAEDVSMETWREIGGIINKN